MKENTCMHTYEEQIGSEQWSCCNPGYVGCHVGALSAIVPTVAFCKCCNACTVIVFRNLQVLYCKFLLRH